MKLQQGRSGGLRGLPSAVWGLLGVLVMGGAVACAPASEEKTETGGSGGSTSAGAGGTAAGNGGEGGSGAGAAGEGGSSGAGAGGDAGAAGDAGAGGEAGSGGAGNGGAGNGGSGGADPLVVGKDCSGSADCPGGTCLDPSSYPGGYCSKVCSGDVITEGDPCPSGAVCVQIVQAAAVCLDACNSQSDCRAGYACRPIPNTDDKVCFPACQSDSDCGSLEKCDTTDGLCKPDATKKGKPGDPCGASDQCLGDGNYCFTNEAYPGGMCSSACTADNVKQECPGISGSNCFAADFGAGIEYTCFGKCKTSVDCRDGYVCSADAGETFQADDKTGACVPTCKNFPCGDGYVCDPTGICVADKQGVAFQVTKQDLGTVSVTANSFKTVSFNLPDNTLSFTLVATPSKPVDAVVPVTVTTPAGVVYDYFDPLKTQYKTLGLSNVPYAGLYPNTPKLSMPGGTYSFEMGATDPVDLKIDVLFKQGSGILSAGTMPMIFYFTQGNSFNAASAKADPVFQQAVNKVKQSYAQIGITLTVDDNSYIDLPSSSQYAVIDERSELAGLFALANNYDASGLNFFFIDQYAFQGGSGVLGISGGIPGSPGLLGVTHAGVSVAYGLLKDDAETLGIVMAHEGGHYLGLFHPTEATGKAFDPLDDTPECPASKFDKNGDGRVDHVECADAGTSNMMFWLVNGPPNKTFTTDQQFVLMRNPLVSH
jgi:hypothetical protein